LFALGIAFGVNGISRSGASNAWMAQVSQDWVQHFPLGANYKHADCNGDGIVDANDTLAIMLNFGSNHPARMTQPQYNPAYPKLKVVPTRGNFTVGGDFDADVFLGDDTIAVDKIYGLKFNLNFDNSMVQPNTASFTTNGCWLGLKNNDLISMVNQKQLGVFAVGLVRTNHSDVSGKGFIGHFHCKTTGNISTPYNFSFTFSDVNAINSLQMPVDISFKASSGLLSDNGVTKDDGSVTIYNNQPEVKQISISTNNFTASSIIMYNAMGQIVSVNQHPNWLTNIETLSLPNGVYWFEINSDIKNTIVKKIEIAH
jgi:hypothetical protein